MSSENEQAYLARLEATIQSLQRSAQESGRELAESQRERAGEARSGAMGPDWQDVQRRIDAGQTSLADVFTGRDDSPAAQRLVRLSQENLTRMAEEVQPPPEVVDELAAADTQWTHLQNRPERTDPE
ncbi:MAG: hypothetical protein ACR2JU_07650 [Nocardioidaceae bacterium]